MAVALYTEEKYESFKDLTIEEQAYMQSIRKSDPSLILPPKQTISAFGMTCNKIDHIFVFRVNGWRIWKGLENKKDILEVKRNGWVDYQLETMFKGWK